ncbi:hypothetical protein IHE44_0010138 [Lamprotornis superbus]|uniref:Uncharacterized protein n=1 Tax=Lamprotornis superbus TaxID=245042 RepID=A0A835NED9_9PASS|nr:hypothetical protein IHE44_0010138 [Lamprotornis superbus]
MGTWAVVAKGKSLRGQLVVCMAKMPHLELPGSRVPLSPSRSGSFPGPYMEFLGNPATLGTMGRKNLEDVQRMLQVMEQYLKSPRG